jgi:spore maturation protein CgeB
MKFALFYPSLVSDWNNGNAHFLRGIVTELLALGHQVEVFEPAGGWSLRNLEIEHGRHARAAFSAAYPHLRSRFYDPADPDPARWVADADVVIVHEWNAPSLVRDLGRERARGAHFRLLFHDTHHRAVTDPEAIARLDLHRYDGVLAFGRVLRDIYLERGWAARAWTWHEAADIRVFRPLPGIPEDGDLVWIGNWGDEERTRELYEFLLGPVSRLRLRSKVHGVRYPDAARAALAEAGIDYGGWLPNHAVPQAFAAFRVTVHIPRRPYAEALPGIPTIRPFEALACGIPLICAPWEDAEGLFTPGQDFLVAQSGREMESLLADVLGDPELARSLSERGLSTVLARHTCGHRAAELLAICAELRLEVRPAASESPVPFAEEALFPSSTTSRVKAEVESTRPPEVLDSRPLRPAPPPSTMS